MFSEVEITTSLINVYILLPAFRLFLLPLCHFNVVALPGAIVHGSERRAGRNQHAIFKGNILIWLCRNTNREI